MNNLTPADRAAAVLRGVDLKTVDRAWLEQRIQTELQSQSNADTLGCRAKHGPPVVKMQRIHEAAVLPTRKSGDAGYDLYAVENMIVPAAGFARLQIGWNIEIPWGWWAKIECRSGLANKGFFTTGGVLDPSYRGEPKVFLHWMPDDVALKVHRQRESGPWGFYTFKPGDRIAQMLVLPVFQGGIEEVAELTPTERGDKGFGSTGR